MNYLSYSNGINIATRDKSSGIGGCTQEQKSELAQIWMFAVGISIQGVAAANHPPLTHTNWPHVLSNSIPQTLANNFLTSYPTISVWIYRQNR